jgi:predicted translation initiation factor SUI1
MSKGGKQILLFLGGEEARTAEGLFNAVAARFGLPWRASACGLAEVTTVDLEGAARLIGVGDVRAALEERFAGWVERVEFWSSAGEREVNGLVARLLGGGGKEPDPEPVADTPVKKTPAQNVPPLKVGRETKGRKGKGVTIIWDIPLDEAGIRELAARLKERCGTGGTVEEGRILIQGDQRERVIAELEKLGYRVKRVGG